MTAEVSRRTLYCSKSANGPHSVATTFDNPDGKIWFEPSHHVWVGGNKSLLQVDEQGNVLETRQGGRCRDCGASQDQYERDDALETYAYAFIHPDARTRYERELGEKLKFDVVIGNPPYQLGSDGGTRDVPIYQLFVEQAKRLEPSLLSMVIPSRWMASGLGLTEFRKTMLEDRHIRALVDYEVMSEVFPGVDFEGGACYFLWDSNYEGPTDYSNVRGSEIRGPDKRFLNEFDVLVRDQRSVEILRKVLHRGFEPVTKILSVDKEFGWTSNFADFTTQQNPGDVQLIFNHKGKRGVGYVSRGQIAKSTHLVDTWKVMVSAAFGERGAVPAKVLGRPFVVGSPSVCTQTYLFFYVDSEAQALNLKSYLSTKFFRFLVSLRKITQHATRSTYSWVPLLSLDRQWSDGDLYERFELTIDQIEFIESIIKPMEADLDTSK
jgi:site-specific DNA-methyltransferase (adenine-specific)